MIVKKIYGVKKEAGNTIWLESTDKVITPTFTDYITIMVVHPEDEELSGIKIGQKYKFKEPIFREGKDGKATGNHFHIVVGRGKMTGTGWTQNNLGAWILTTEKGTCRPEDVFFIDETFTKIENTKGLQFKTLNINYEIGYVACNSLNVRNGPSYYKKVINSLPKNTKVNILEKKAEWFRIGENQWVSKNFIFFEVPNNVISTKITTSQSLNVRNSPNGTKLKNKAPLLYHTVVANIKTSGKWTMIEKNRWVNTSFLE